MQTRNVQTIFSTGIYLLSAIIGVTAFLYPFFLPQSTNSANGIFQVQSALTPLITVSLLIICLVVLFLEVQGEAVSAKVLGALGVLVAAAASLRFLEVAIPGPGGFSPIFAPIILTGYVFGARFGFLMGTMTLVVSALITGGIGPWLPYQMFAAGWVGLTAGWLPHFKNQKREMFLLVVFGVFWGFLYGLMMNLYFWPFMSGMAENLSWETGLDSDQAFIRYISFYLTTSLIWDVMRAAGNGLLIAVLGIPTITALTRFKNRFHFRVQPI